MSDDIQAVVHRGLEAAESGDIEAANRELTRATKLAGESHCDVLHLSGRINWAEGDYERAAGYLMQAADAGSDNPDLYLDCAEVLLAIGEDLPEAEAVLHVVMKMDDLDREQLDNARLMMARVRLEGEDCDPEEALELVSQLEREHREHPFPRTIRAEALTMLERYDEAIAEILLALETEPAESDYHYQLGVVYQLAGRGDEAVAAMKRVLELDLAESGASESIDYAQAQDLRGLLEEIFEDLPDPLLRRVARAPITVQARPCAAQVELGIDPRGVIAFEGVRREGDDDDDASAADDDGPELAGIVIMRDLLHEEVEDEADIPEELEIGLLCEFRRFFGLDELALAHA